MTAPHPDRLGRALWRLRRARAAAGYEDASVLQRELAQRMRERLQLVALKPSWILDAGAGTGSAARELAAQFPQARVIALEACARLLEPRPTTWWERGRALFSGPRVVPLVGEVDALPLATSSVDLVWSNLALQSVDADRAIAEAWRVLRADGLYMFTALGPDTLVELRTAFAGLRGGSAHFADMHDVGDALVAHGFSAPVMDVERFTLTYADLAGLMRDLRANAATSAMPDRGRGLLGRNAWRRANERYEAYRTEGRLPATFEVVYGHAWKAVRKGPEMPDGRRVIQVHPSASRRSG